MNFKMQCSTVLLGLMLSACRAPEVGEFSALRVTSVQQSPVKRQSIGNCWIYAQASWLESLLKITNGNDLNVSESYWTYWDLYDKLLERTPLAQDKLDTGGNWDRLVNIIKNHGWVEEKDFIATERDALSSSAQLCAKNYLLRNAQKGGALAEGYSRTPEFIKGELDKAFSCNGTIAFSMDYAQSKSHAATETQLKDPKTGVSQTLASLLQSWHEIGSPGFSSWGPYEGKKLASASELDGYRRVEQRIKRALNDHQPVILAFFVTFNAPDRDGLFNLKTLAEAGDLGETGAHMVVLEDYTVNQVPSAEGMTSLPEGELSPDLKEAALLGDLNYLVVKNSWGYDRSDRPWLRNGYSRLSWLYLRSHYYDENEGRFLPFLRSVVLPPGYD